MPGDGSPLNIEQAMQTSEPDHGYAEDLLLPLGSWRDKSGLTLTASTEPDVSAVNGQLGLKWDHGGAASDFALCDFTMPLQFAENQDRLKLVVAARKLDAAADENADLMIQAQVLWSSPGKVNKPSETNAAAAVPTQSVAPSPLETLNTLTTPAKALLAAAVINSGDPGNEGIFEYELDIGARLRAEGKRINAGDRVEIRFGPNETVGSADMDLETSIPILRIVRHASLLDRTARRV